MLAIAPACTVLRDRRWQTRLTLRVSGQEKGAGGGLWAETLVAQRVRLTPSGWLGASLVASHQLGVHCRESADPPFATALLTHHELQEKIHR